MSAEQTPDIAALAAVLTLSMHAECPPSGVECRWLADPDGDPACLPEHVAPLASHLAAALAPVLAAAVREAEQRANLLAPWGPFEMGGFEGCTDRNPDMCACGTDQQPVCRICAQEIEPGEQAWARQWPCYDTLPLDDPTQDWDVISWHDECPSGRADRITEPVSHEAATSGEEASKA